MGVCVRIPGLYLILMISVFFAGCTTKAIKGDPEAEAIIKKVVEDNLYTTHRGLKEYIQYFGPEFEQDIDSLTESMHWIDGGAGSANAQKDYLKTRADKSIPFLTPITVKYPAAEPRILHGGKFKVFADRYFEEIPLEDIASADIITDVVGILNYTLALDVSLDKYLKLLKPGGKIYVFIPPHITDIETKSGKVFKLREWLTSIPGLATRSLKTPHSPYPNELSYVVEKQTEKINVPKLRLEKAVHDHVVLRKFREI